MIVTTPRQEVRGVRGGAGSTILLEGYIIFFFSIFFCALLKIGKIAEHVPYPEFISLDSGASGEVLASLPNAF